MTITGFFTSKELGERYKISSRTLNRWQNRSSHPFPKPTIPATGSLNRWSYETVEEWELGDHG
ncbi:MAG: hypothetical protein HRT93_07880 [Piscirickettsiaceae bacterium]|nr:hypothetical protein [Piscirickettsiaceae bacterium]